MTNQPSSNIVNETAKDASDQRADLKSLSEGDLLQQLCESIEGLPTELLREIQSRGEAIVPGLIDVLRADFELAIKGEAVRSSGSFFAFALLGAIGDDRALPAVVDAVRLPDDAGNRLLGDALEDTLQRSIVNLIGDEIDLLDQLMTDTDIPAMRRWNLAGCYIRLVADGRLSREAAADRLTGFITDEIEKDQPDGELVTGLCLEVSAFAIESSLSAIRKAYERGIAQEIMVTLQELEDDIAEGDAHFKSCQRELPLLDFDVADYFASWAAFDDTEIEEEDDFLEEDFDSEDEQMWKQMMGMLGGLGEGLEAGSFDELQEHIQDGSLDETLLLPDPVPPADSFAESSVAQLGTTIRNEGRSAGRNDPCPCGSGKKRKKCCR